MKIFLFLFLFFSIFLVARISAEMQTQYGNQATVAIGGENVDLETFALQGSAVLSSPQTEAGDSTLSAVYFLFKGDKSAGVTVSIDCVGGKGSYLALVDVKKSTRAGDIRWLIIPIDQMAEVNGKKAFSVANPTNYMDKDGNIEIHIISCDGWPLTLNSVSVEFIKNKTEGEVRKSVNLARCFLGSGFIPPGAPKIMLDYHHGEVWLSDDSPGQKGWKTFDIWWNGTEKFIPPDGSKYIVRFN